MSFKHFVCGFLISAATCLAAIVGSEYAISMINAKNAVSNIVGVGLMCGVVVGVTGSILFCRRFFGGE